MKKGDTNGLSLGGISLLQVYGCIQQEQVIVSINPRCKNVMYLGEDIRGYLGRYQRE